MTDSIALEGMVFYGYHGVYEEERRLGQRFVVDLRLDVDLREAGRSDRLEASVDYVQVYRDVRAVVEGEPLRLIEAVAERIAQVVLDRHPRVARVTVTVKKPAVPLPGALAHAAVTLSRGREDLRRGEGAADGDKRGTEVMG